ncbi:hypothetical protein Hdeb2414_s0014g00435021 [Helianthus debilis subsp. tardiflorus]
MKKQRKNITDSRNLRLRTVGYGPLYLFGCTAVRQKRAAVTAPTELQVVTSQLMAILRCLMALIRGFSVTI